MFAVQFTAVVFGMFGLGTLAVLLLEKAGGGGKKHEIHSA
jgi:hypothetical protein